MALVADGAGGTTADARRHIAERGGERFDPFDRGYWHVRDRDDGEFANLILTVIQRFGKEVQGGGALRFRQVLHQDREHEAVHDLGRQLFHFEDQN